jgi:hypothetical protein
VVLSQHDRNPEPIAAIEEDKVRRRHAHTIYPCQQVFDMPIPRLATMMEPSSVIARPFGVWFTQWIEQLTSHFHDSSLLDVFAVTCYYDIGS